MGDEKNGKNGKKEYNRDKPFSRINYPKFGEKGPNGEDRLSGLGSACGCNTEDDYPVWGMGLAAAVITELRRIMNAVPAWVPAMTDINRPDEERETQGILVRSFQTWTDVPLRQWHYYYDWNFHVSPDEGFGYCRGQANVSPSNVRDQEVLELKGGFRERKRRRFDAVMKGENMECEWDTGAFGRRPGGMFRWHWQWPMSGEQVWCVGRPIYDCGHPGNDPSDPHTFGRTRSELHPVKAIASARWEAEKFPENGENYVPAIKFMFFGCRIGGYWNFDKLNDQEYEFIVDLPKFEALRGPFAIGHTPDFAMNTIRLAPRLLMKLDYAPFEQAMAEVPNAIEERLPRFGKVTPIVTAPDDFDPEKPQAKIKIPLKGLSGDAFGVVISLGWSDPAGTAAKKVKKVTVTFESLFTGTGVHTEGDLRYIRPVFVDEDPETSYLLEHWRVKLGVNGRWFWFDSVSDSVTVQERIVLKGMTHTFWLAEDDILRLSAHGSEVNSVDGMMNEDHNRRLVTFQPFPWVDGEPVQYIRDVQNGGAPGPPTAANRDARILRQQDVFREFMWRMVPFRAQSAPLGLIDKVVKLSELPEGETVRHDVAFFTREVGESAELAETPDLFDYVVTSRISVQSQK